MGHTVIRPGLPTRKPNMEAGLTKKPSGTNKAVLEMSRQSRHGYQNIAAGIRMLILIAIGLATLGRAIL